VQIFLVRDGQMLHVGETGLTARSRRSCMPSSGADGPARYARKAIVVKRIVHVLT
jgi:hypothetical protein